MLLHTVPAMSGGGILGYEPMRLAHATPGYLTKSKGVIRVLPSLLCVCVPLSGRCMCTHPVSPKIFEGSKVQPCIYVHMWFDKASLTFSALDNPFRVLSNCL